MKTLRYALLPLALLPLALSVGTAAAQNVSGPQSVEQRLHAAGYAEVRDIEFGGGLWEAEVRRADGRWGEVAVEADSGEIFDARSDRHVLDLAEAQAALQRQGYTDITDLDRDGALWEAEARDRSGQRVELVLSGYDGRVLDSDVEYDHDD